MCHRAECRRRRDTATDIPRFSMTIIRSTVKNLRKKSTGPDPRSLLDPTNKVVDGSSRGTSPSICLWFLADRMLQCYARPSVACRRRRRLSVTLCLRLNGAS